MSRVTDQIMQDAGVEIPQRLRPTATEAPPPLPTVGRMVHFYHKGWTAHATGLPVPGPGPYSAVVSRVIVSSESGGEIVASVDLSVFTNNNAGPVQVIYDVPGIIPGVDHQHIYWWQWPERS